MRHVARGIAAACALALSAGASGAQFYLFPVKEIEGVSKEARDKYKLLDQKLMARLFDDEAGRQAQRQLIKGFVGRLNAAYPESLVHPRQVADVKVVGTHKFIDDDNLQCKASPSVAVGDTYAVMLGITRASVYEVPKGENIDVLIPITLNVQFVRPSLGKVVYTISETVYSPFSLGRREYESGAADAVIRQTLIRNLETQAASLVASARQAFDPKDVNVKIVGRDGDFYVTDRGAEAGFVKGEQVEARDAAGKEAIFDVLYADTGYAVIKAAAGSVSVGSSLKFIFESAADASTKPRIMPVVSQDGSDSWASSVAALFEKDIGFKASFQMAPVDVNFAQTKELLTRSANCVTWQKIAGMAEATGSPKDAPDYFLRFTPTVSPSVTLAGAGGTKTEEMFRTLVTAQVIDRHGRVIYSGLGDDNYSIKRIDGEGLGLAQAKEVSLKNATAKLAQNFLANVRFAPRDYKIERVDKEKVWVSGLSGMPAGGKVAFDILHPLDAKVGGKPALLDLEAGSGSGGAATDGELVGFPYAAVNPALPRPRSGDLLRLYTEVPPNATRVIDCDEPVYVGKDNLIDVGYFSPLARHAQYQSKKFASYVGDPKFYAQANSLLSLGLFDTKLERPSVDVCSQPGYTVREVAAPQCDGPQSCKVTVQTGMLVHLKKDSQVQKTFVSGLRTDFGGFPSSEKNAFYGYRGLENGLSMQADLINKMNSN
ncbi:hypothetical protein [Massilia sp. IC2-476]|uniref:hypothetical protein n=1 Tax=Massilia sp. IC2-476 TaxID=2887199 RepID=UPI001D0FDB14|nr:hypothetical protein [Massilia sp. IC2-476]MCC2971176.1 hypothetical protein [Massilia sp. IC2-476]